MSFQKAMLVCPVAVLMTVLSGMAAASGFALIEQSGSGLGNAYAGGAASAEDASTVFFNPAGMTRLRGKQGVIAAHLIKPSIKFAGTALPGNDMGGDAGNQAVIPSAYFSMEISPGLHAGLGINVPFGLETEYDSTWVGRVHSIKSKIETININPSIAYRVNESLSIGAGINYQHIKGELTSFAGAAGTSKIEGDDESFGYNIGILYNFTPQTRLGLSYRSSIKHTLTGDATFSANPALNTPVSMNLEVPDSYSISMFHRMSDQWDLMVDFSHTGWDKFQNMTIVRANGTTLKYIPENWENTWRSSIGVNHHYSEKWTSRFGVAFDQSPVQDAYRTARIPDSDRTWLALGGQYKPTKDDAFDIGYAHLFMKDSTINSTVDVPALVGNYKSHVDILCVQYTHSF